MIYPQLKKIGTALIVLGILSPLAGYALPPNEIDSPLSSSFYLPDQFQENTLATLESYGKSTLFNETDTLIHIEYKVCEYDVKGSNYLNIRCDTQSKVDINPHQFLEFEFKPQMTNEGVTHYHQLYIFKAYNDNAYQYYLSDPNDLLSYSQYLKSKPQGVIQEASSCEMGNGQDLHLYSVGKRFLCH